MDFLPATTDNQKKPEPQNESLVEKVSTTMKAIFSSKKEVFLKERVHHCFADGTPLLEQNIPNATLLETKESIQTVGTKQYPFKTVVVKRKHIFYIYEQMRLE